MDERLCSRLLTGATAVSRALERASVVAVIVLAMLAFAAPAQAASFTVDDLSDAPDASAGDGTCADSSGNCTLRAAIEEANALAGDGAIGFAEGSSGTIALANGELSIRSNLTITGPGADKLTVSGGGKSRVFAAYGGGVNISGLTITDGQSNRWGGGLYVRGTLTVRNIALRDNNAADGGGGLYVDDGGDLTVQDSTIAGNNAERGGGIYAYSNVTGEVTVQNSTVSGNSAIGGGGIYNAELSQTTLRNSTVSGNNASQVAGGIYNWVASLTVQNSTINDNYTTGFGDGGGIRNEGGIASVQNSTISGNRGPVSGGIYNYNYEYFPGRLTVQYSTITDNEGFDVYNHDGATVEVGNSIIATERSTYDVAGAFTSRGYNLIGAVDGSTGFTNGANGDRTGTRSAPLDPKLGPLADNGGPTRTHALLSDSPAIDVGDPAFAPPPESDQRGDGYPRKQGARVDIGAFEAQTDEGGDTVPPRLDLPADITEEATSPRGAIVNFDATAQDDMDESVAVSCSPSSGSTFPMGTTTVDCSVEDAAGNEAVGSFDVTVRDTTPPEISGVPSDTTKTATSSSGTKVGYQESTATDVVDGGVPVECSPASGNTFALGTTTVSCSATDKAGNEAEETFKVTVAYSWSGVLKPIKPDRSSVFRLRSTVPVRFKLTGESARITDATAKLYVAKVSNDVVGDEVEANSAAATSGNLFRYDAKSDQYVFSWATKGLEAGTYRLRIDLGDGIRNTVRISLR